MFKQIDRNLWEKVNRAWIVDMQRLWISIPFFLLFLTFASQKGFNNVYTLASINVQTTDMLLFVNSSQWQNFQNIHRTKLLHVDNFSPNFGAWQMKRIEHHYTSIIELFPALYMGEIYSDKASRIIKRYRTLRNHKIYAGNSL